MKLTGKKLCKEYMVVLICLLIIGNLTQGTVLCFGADGHVELEPAFHNHCDHLVHLHASGQNQHSHEPGHEKSEHCAPCVDIPISAGLTKISHTFKLTKTTSPAPAANVFNDTDKINCSAFDLISNTSVDTSYFTPLRTVILLV
ncbi:MAG: hypothetical protein GWN67_12320 [Phycisphaerae bacterium]|nr:hypothetical protein [Phycisphaerae bacterium]NIR67185.1 hypothetical protein [candidate division Zixibacteria bacterium]NIP53639.1 hypothetical protein [Phycisphaerae bacterium]NIS51909.1 hypothetical protein [Phycisphaerae bacterium]NIU09420.1 hypothetical protein [Phycisphaerae bacterium]